MEELVHNTKNVGLTGETISFKIIPVKLTHIFQMTFSAFVFVLNLWKQFIVNYTSA